MGIVIGDPVPTPAPIPDAPSQEPTPPWQTPPVVWPGERPGGISIQDYMQQLVYNAMLQYMDPITAGTTREWLARTNPVAFASYRGTGFGYLPPGTTPPPAPSGQPSQPVTTQDGTSWTWNGTDWVPTLPTGATDIDDVLSSQNLTDVWNYLMYGPGGGLYEQIPETFKQEMKGSVLTPPPTGQDTWSPQEREVLSQQQAAAGNEALAGINWLREAINTARGAMRGESTRAQQQLAGAHLATLFREAEQNPTKAGKYSTLFENIVNPVMFRTPQSGIFGYTRSVVPPPGGDFMRKGIAFRNPSYT